MKTTFLWVVVSLLLFNVGCNILRPSSKLKVESGPALSSGPLIGKWQNIENSSHVLEYKPDGTLINTYYENVSRDTYFYIGKDQLSVTDSSGKIRFPNFAVKGDELTLTWPDAVIKDAAIQQFKMIK